jgi:polyphosphate glucokinase
MGALVDSETGLLTAERFRLATPAPSSPKAVAKVIRSIVEHFAWTGPVGVAFPGRVRHGHIHVAANLDKEWLGLDAGALFAERTGCPTVVINDADAAGVAEMAFGAGRGRRDLVLMLTFGTGIGSGLFYDGVLIPNTELGHLWLNGKHAETFAADRARKRDGLTWKEWARRVQEYLDHLEFILAPDLFILGGGISREKKRGEYLHLLKTQAELVGAQLQNEAGLIGAAHAACPR